MPARAEGYTLAMVTHRLYRQPFITETNYDVSNDFNHPIAITIFEPGLAVRADSPWHILDKLLNAAGAESFTYRTRRVWHGSASGHRAACQGSRLQ